MYLCGIPTSYHGEAGEAAGIQGMGDTDGGGIATCGGDAVSSQVFRLPKVNSGSVGGPMPNSGDLRA